MKTIVTLALSGLIASAASGQSFNVDIGPEGSTPPPSTYAAAGNAGIWFSTTAAQGPGVGDLVDVNGNVTIAWFSQIGGTETLSFRDESVTGDDATLLTDAIITHTGIENCLFFNNMEPGKYVVLVYAWMPGEPSILNRTNVDQEEGNPHLLVGGPWSGEHQELVTYARHVAFVAAEGTQAGKLGLHSGVPPGGNFTIGAALNGVQIIQIPPGDVDENGSVTVQDLLALLASWGACPVDGCPADVNGDGVVNVQDLLVVLANWG